MNIFRRIMARAKNDTNERIESLRFSVPALRVGVLEYGAGQLQTNNTALDGKPVRLYYPPEAVSDAKFLKSLETAPVVVGGHDSTTNEQNKKIDGWAHNVSYDALKKAAMLDGVVKGAKEVAYIRGNLGSAGFGASAFVDIFNLKVENGVTPDGQEYNAIANELRATHVALAPHVRDPENKIRVANAVCINTAGEMTVNNAQDIKFSAMSGGIMRVTYGGKAYAKIIDMDALYKKDKGGVFKVETDISVDEFLSLDSAKTFAKRYIEDRILSFGEALKNTEEENNMELSDAQIALMVKNMAEEMAAELRATAKNMTTEWKKVEITYEDGSVRKTEISATADDAFIRDLYQVGKVGLTASGKYEKVKSVKIL